MLRKVLLWLTFTLAFFGFLRLKLIFGFPIIIDDLTELVFSGAIGIAGVVEFSRNKL